MVIAAYRKNIYEMKMNMNLAFNKEKCCGCGMCVNVCPKQAIQMREDEHGFIYPFIFEKLCINCRKCSKICAFKNSQLDNTPLQCYAGITSITDINLSSSGGIFAALASSILDSGGIVFGAALENVSNTWKVKHIEVFSKKDLPLIMGSKYLQSRITEIFPHIRKAVKSGRKVLFSGTPCQCDAVRSYLSQDYNNLLLVDILCHGVPNEVFFNGYINILQKSLKSEIKDFRFRDKKNGWQYKTAKVISDKCTRYIFSNESSYLDLFEKGIIIRPSCYNCKYACASRVGDITLGDFWGALYQMPELFCNPNSLNVKKGVSAVIVNTTSGAEILKDFSASVRLFETSFEAIAQKNHRLYYPTVCPDIRKEVMELYTNRGYQAVHSWWKNYTKKRRIFRYIKNRIPSNIRKWLGKLIKK